MDFPFVTAVEAIYAAAPNPSLWPQALQSIADVFGDIGAILIWRRDDGGFGTIVSPSLAIAQRDYEEHGWYLRDLCAQRTVERELWLHGDAANDRHAVTDEEMATHPIYTEFFARHDLRWRAIVGVAPDPHVSVFLAIQRSGRKDAHSDVELTLATRLGRHVEKALRLSIRLLDTELANVGLGAALARLGIGVFALDSQARVVFANKAGEDMLGDGLTIANERLLAAAVPARAELEGAIEHMIRAEPTDLAREPRPILVQRVRSARPLAAYVLPVALGSIPAAQFLTHTRAIVLVIDPKSDEPADPAVVRDVLGLTLGEAKVAALVGAGFAPREAAERLGIAEATARSALKHVFAKTGVARQSELAALLTRMVLR
ncbi:MAG TPA: helix-turn-helix transcriptional regulator [Pseudolabrys sp.]|nr:helix-turn-helix transcriptional regulator [Pseudolabrys sp.]